MIARIKSSKAINWVGLEEARGAGKLSKANNGGGEINYSVARSKTVDSKGVVGKATCSTGAKGKIFLLRENF